MGKILKIGIPVAFQDGLIQIAFIVITIIANQRGLNDAAAVGIVEKVISFLFLVPSSMLSTVSALGAQNIGAGNVKRAKKSMFTGIAVGVAFGIVMFALVLRKGDVLAGLFSTDAEVVRRGFEYLRGFAPETIVTAVLFSMVGYFNGSNQTLWVMIQGLIQTLLVRLPLAYYMSIQPNASLTKIGMSAPVATVVGIVLNIGCFLYLNWRDAEKRGAE